jgi:pilus assembly protein CpaB
MMLRRFLLALGAGALALGILLLVVSMRAPVGTRMGQAPTSEPARTLLVATRTIPAGSLLRPDDMHWQAVPVEQVLAGSYSRDVEGFRESDLVGAAARRDLNPGEQLLADQFVRPDEPGFLPAVLKPGRRAVTIAVNPAEVNAGLVTPGDSVDIILTQTFGEPGLGISRRSAAETVLRNLRVIAVDQSLHIQAQKSEERHFIAGSGGGGGGSVPKTVTLEVTVLEAQQLMLAGQLGKLQLSLRGFSENDASVSPAPPPTWASEVSAALASLDRTAPPPADRSAPPPGRNAATAVAAQSSVDGYYGAVAVIRGTRVEQNCFDQFGRSTAQCGAAGVIPASTAPAGRARSVGAGAVAPAS